jgi:DNA polymerase-3 subunit delta
MQLPFYQLDSHLKQTLFPCYLLHSDEWLLAEEAQENIINAAKQKGFSVKKTFYIQQESDWHTLMTHAQSLDLFANKSIYVIRHFSGSFTTAIQQCLEKQLHAKSFSQLWIMMTGKLKKTDQRKSWYKKISQQGVIIPIYELKGIALKKWIQNKLNVMKLKIESQEVIDQLIALTEGNLLATSQTIEKLKLLFPKQCLTTKQIQSAYDNSRFTVFQLVDELLKGQTQKALHILNYLHQANHPPLLILWAIANQIRELIKLAQQLSQGVAMQRLLQSQWASRRTYFQAALSRLSLHDLEQLLLFCSKIDKMLKSIHSTEAWKALDVLTIRFNHSNFLRG